MGTRGEGDPRSPGTERRKNPGAGSRAGAQVSQSCPSLRVLFLSLLLCFLLLWVSSLGFLLPATLSPPPPLPSQFHPLLPIEDTLSSLGLAGPFHRILRSGWFCQERTRKKSERGGGVLFLHRVCVRGWGVGGKEMKFLRKSRETWTGFSNTQPQMMLSKRFSAMASCFERSGDPSRSGGGETSYFPRRLFCTRGSGQAVRPGEPARVYSSCCEPIPLPFPLLPRGSLSRRRPGAAGVAGEGGKRAGSSQLAPFHPDPGPNPGSGCCFRLLASELKN